MTTTRRFAICGLLLLAGLAPASVQAKDTRILAIEKLLLTSWNNWPDDMVVEVVLDPVTSQADRRSVLRFYLDRQKQVGGHRDSIQQTYLPRLERMFKQMPSEDIPSYVLILQGMASLLAEKNHSDAPMLAFIQGQLQQQSLSPARRLACETLRAQIQGQDLEAVSQQWRSQESRILELLSKGTAGQAYSLAMSVVSDAQRSSGDRMSALKYLDRMLTAATDVPFQQTRLDLTSAGMHCSNPRLAAMLVRSIMRAAFLEYLDADGVQHVIDSLAQGSSPLVQEAARAVLSNIRDHRQNWQFDIQEHLVEANRLVQQAGLSDAGQRQYQILVASPDYVSHPVGESPRWWLLAKFLSQYNAPAASVEAFRKYLSTRNPSIYADSYLQEAIGILDRENTTLGHDPIAFWTDLARLPKPGAADAFIKGLAHRFPRQDTGSILVRIGLAILQRNDSPYLAEAVLRNVDFTPEDVTSEGIDISPDHLAGGLRAAVCAAWARQGKYEQALSYLDLARQAPLPGVPLFRVLGLADCLFAQGKGNDAEKLVRSLLLRDLSTDQRINLLVCLVDGYLKAGNTQRAIQVQAELFQQYAVTSPQAIVAALTRCIDAVHDKNPAAEIACTRMLCEVMNGDTYPDTGNGPADGETLAFWRAVLAWSRDNAQTQGLRTCLKKADSPETDLARVLLARSDLNQQQDRPAAQLLAAINDSSPMAALAREERRRLHARLERTRILADHVRQIAAGLVQTLNQSGQADLLAEAHLLLAEFGSDTAQKTQSLSAALDLCAQNQVGPDSAVLIAAQLRRIRSSCGDKNIQAQCDALKTKMDALAPAASQPSEADERTYLGEPLDAAYLDAMYQLGQAFRTAGQYQRAVECCHRGFQRAPFAVAAARLLKEEVWTLTFYLANLDESQTRLRQLLAIYPQELSGQWARTYLSTLANPARP